MNIKIDVEPSVQVVYYIEDGEQCWTLDLDYVEKCERRGYPYEVIEYKTVVDFFAD